MPLLGRGGRGLFSVKIPANHSTAFPTHTPPSPGPWLLSLAWHMVEILPKTPFPVSAWQEDTTSKNTVERWWGTDSGSHTHARTCKNLENFVHLPVPRHKSLEWSAEGLDNPFIISPDLSRLYPVIWGCCGGVFSVWGFFLSSRALLEEE